MKLLPLLSLSALLASCLYTEPIVAVAEEPLSPSVGFNATLPLLSEQVSVDPAVLQFVPFQILVIEEPNLDDTLFIRWFVNDDLQVYGEFSIEPCDPSTSDCVPSPIRSLSDKDAVKIDLEIGAFGVPPEPGIHRVAAIITDRPFLTPFNRPISGNRDTDPEANVHYLHWEVNVLP